MQSIKNTYLCGFFCFVLLLLLSACGSTPQQQVHMDETNFVQQSITIHKGESITLVNDSQAIHVITNGSWRDGMQLPTIENGAPPVNVDVNSNVNQDIGPFNTAGTFHLYCTIHPNMNLTVSVQ